MTFRLNVFSNVASRRLSDNFCARAIRSFEEAFDIRCDFSAPTRLYVDPNPNPDLWEDWVATTIDAVVDRDIEVVETDGMADGYLRSVRDGDTDFLVQLEHDFVFKRRIINHSIAQLTHCMDALDADYLRFNKRWNRATGSDAFLIPADDCPVPVCWTNSRSNNPHIVDRRAYQTIWLPLCERLGGALLEGGVCRYLGGGLVYGGLGLPASVGHLDGRSVRWKDVMLRPFQP
jgi:hypothetical protein